MNNKEDILNTIANSIKFMENEIKRYSNEMINIAYGDFSSMDIDAKSSVHYKVLSRHEKEIKSLLEDFVNFYPNGYLDEEQSRIELQNVKSELVDAKKNLSQAEDKINNTHSYTETSYDHKHYGRIYENILKNAKADKLFFSSKILLKEMELAMLDPKGYEDEKNREKEIQERESERRIDELRLEQYTEINKAIKNAKNVDDYKKIVSTMDGTKNILNGFKDFDTIKNDVEKIYQSMKENRENEEKKIEEYNQKRIKKFKYIKNTTILLHIIGMIFLLLGSCKISCVNSKVIK